MKTCPISHQVRSSRVTAAMNDECISDIHPDNEWRHRDDDSGLRYADVVPESEGVIVRIRQQTAFLELAVLHCSAVLQSLPSGRPWYRPSLACAGSSSQLLPNCVTKCKGRARAQARPPPALTQVRRFSPDSIGRGGKSKVQVRLLVSLKSRW